MMRRLRATIGEEPRAIIARRTLLLGTSGLIAFAALSSASANAAQGHIVDVGGWGLPSLAFTMTDADTGHAVTARNFHGKVVLLYFGYTNCPDVCPMTLHNIAVTLGRLGKDATRVRALFVTVDPNRDTIAVLRKYTALFAPEIVGLRGTPDQLAALASRYHIGYSVSPATASHPYEVNHSSGIYVFGANGSARLLIPSLDSSTSDIAGTASALARLLKPDERMQNRELSGMLTSPSPPSGAERVGVRWGSSAQRQVRSARQARLPRHFS